MILLGLEVAAGSYVAYRGYRLFKSRFGADADQAQPQGARTRAVRAGELITPDGRTTLPMIADVEWRAERPGRVKRSIKWLVARRSLAPVLVLAAAAAYFVGAGGLRYFSFDGLRLFGQQVGGVLGAAPWGVALAFVSVYAATTAMALPVVAFMGMASGFMFGSLFGAALSVTGATLGGLILFASIRSAMRDSMVRRYDERVEALRARARDKGRNLLLTLRMLPIFPLALVNIAAAALGFSTGTFVADTVLGVIPLAVAYASLGAGIAELAQGATLPGLAALAQPSILIPLLALTLITAIPMWAISQQHPEGPTPA